MHQAESDINCYIVYLMNMHLSLIYTCISAELYYISTQSSNYFNIPKKSFSMQIYTIREKRPSGMFTRLSYDVTSKCVPTKKNKEHSFKIHFGHILR